MHYLFIDRGIGADREQAFEVNMTLEETIWEQQHQHISILCWEFRHITIIHSNASVTAKSSHIHNISLNTK